MDQELQITVIGAGHGGKSMAADLAARGYNVRLYNRSYANIEAIVLRRGIEVTLEDGRQEFGFLRCATSDMAQALAGVYGTAVGGPDNIGSFTQATGNNASAIGNGARAWGKGTKTWESTH